MKQTEESSVLLTCRNSIVNIPLTSCPEAYRSVAGHPGRDLICPKAYCLDKHRYALRRPPLLEARMQAALCPKSPLERLIVATQSEPSATTVIEVDAPEMCPSANVTTQVPQESRPGGWKSRWSGTCRSPTLFNAGAGKIVRSIALVNGVPTPTVSIDEGDLVPRQP